MPFALRIMLNETQKGLLLLWNYRVNMLLEAVAMCGVFVGLNFLVGNGDLPQDQVSSSLLGYIIWLYTFMAVSNMGWSLREEVQAGTLEQMFMSPASPQLLMMGRTLANFLTTSLTMILIMAVMIPAFGLTFPLRATSLVVFAWTMLGLFGLGLMVGGATLVFKHVESLAYLAQYGIMFLNGSILPVDKLPAWLELPARLLPGTQGIIVLRQVTLEDQSLSAVWADGSLSWLMLHSVVFFAAGWLIFRSGERYVRRQGALGHY